jgi:alcohol dehydrogenase (NADP+)
MASLATPATAVHARENFQILRISQRAFDEINIIRAGQRFNEVVKSGIPGFIPTGA